MIEKKELTKKQQYLQYLILELNDSQIDQMIAVLKHKKTVCTANISGYANGSDPYKELMEMIGCDDAKKQLTNMIAAFRMNKIAESRNRKNKQPYFHAVFTRNPGCAKTTCARLYAKALADEGIIKKSICVELTRADLCGRYQGETALKVRDKFQRHKGKLILIDEAYSLYDESPGNKNNYGEEAINEIIVWLENNPETVVIFAGYPDKMEEFLTSNPGLRSRIPYHVKFQDYTPEELVSISKKIAEENGYVISDTASIKLLSIFGKERNIPNFGNGRFARNLVEAAIRTKALNIGIVKTNSLTSFMDPNLYSDEVLFSLDENCFDYCDKTIVKVKPKIGFL